MNRILPLALALAFAASAGARDIVATNAVETVFTWHVTDLPGGGLEITGIDPKPVLEFEVPAAFSTENQTFPVKRIGNGAFANAIGMTSVALPSTLERIGDSAFANCTSLADITIPYGVREIGKRPFVNTIITGLALPDSIIKIDGNIAAGSLFDLGNALADSSHFLVTADGAVYNRDQTRLYACPTRTEGTLALPESLTEIGTDAFFGCFRLTYLNIPASVTNIGETAFNVSGIWPGLDAPESSAKFKTLIFNGDPPEVADNTFDGTPADLSILTFSTNWPATWKGYTVTILDPSDPNLPTLEYTDINGLKWRYRILPDSVEIVELLSKTAAGVNVEELEEGKTNRKVVDVPRAIFGFPVTKLCDESFKNCSSITYLRIPQTVKEIGSGAFQNCTSLLALQSLNVAPFWFEDGLVSLPAGIRKLGNAPFEGTPIAQLSLPSTLTEIDGNPMRGCEFLATIEIADNNPNFSVVDNALYDKRKTEFLGMPANGDIGSISLPPSTKLIGKGSFYGCKYLDSVNLPAILTTIGEDAFTGCSFLAELTIPASVTAIGDAAFSDCASLAKMTFEGVEPAAPDNIFDGSENVTVYGREENGWSGEEWKGRTLTVFSSSEEPADTTLSQTINGITWHFRVADSIAEIWNDGKVAVESESPIMSVNLPQTLGGYVVKGLGNGSLANLRGITSVSVPSTYEWIGDFAFSNCTSLASVTIPEGIREIGHWPFYGTALTELSIPDSVSAIDGNPVAGCTLMKEIKAADSQPYFAAEDGLLYDKRKATLLACPATKAEIALPDTVTTIADDAFYGCDLLAGGEDQVGDAVWSYELADGQAQVTAVVGATNVVTVPATLGGCPVTGIAPDAFNGCSGIAAFAVEPGSTAFATRNGALYSADGKTLIRVPDTFKLPVTVTTTKTEVTISEMIVPRINADGTDGTEYTVSTGMPSTTTSRVTITPTVSLDKLFDGISRIEDFAFFGCGKVESSETATTNEVSSITGFIGDTVYVKTTSTVKSLTVVPTCAISVPASIAFSDASFANSGITEATHGQPSGNTRVRVIQQPSVGPDETAPTADDLEPQTAYLGWLTKNGVIAGSLTLKTGRLIKGVLKATGSYQLIGKKKVAVRSADSLVPAGYGCVLAEDIAKTGAFNAFKGKVWTLAFSTLDNGGYPLMNGFSTFTATVSAKGKVKVTGYLADGTKVSVATAMVSVDGKIRIPVVAPLYTGKKGGFALVMDVDAQGEVTVSELSELISIAADKTSRTVSLGVVATGSPAREFDGLIRFDEGGLPTGASVDFQNLGWKPRYTKKSGLIKGSIATRQGTKRVKATVWGVMIGDQGYGTGIIKKTGSWEIFLD